MVFAALFAIGRPADTTLREFAINIVAVGVLVMALGGESIFLVAKASSEPVEALHRALGEVERGRLDTRVQIWDGTELGVLQAGFNTMVVGLQERERIRDLFGKHVGEDVAHVALSSGVRFDGEQREVSVLFVDLVGSTTLAESTSPAEVVATWNRFFEVIIDVVHAHHGWINKFQGDAALAIWGAPVAVDERQTLALSAARVLGNRLRQELPEVEAGIGVSDGLTVTGNVGASKRYEYTAIGDRVNEAARLTEVAKATPGGVVANAAMLEHASPSERDLWRDLDPVLVRGRAQQTCIAAPRWVTSPFDQADRGCRAASVDRVTASTRPVPVTRFCTQLSTPLWLRPERAKASRYTATSVPRTLNLPGLIVVAPWKTATSAGIVSGMPPPEAEALPIAPR